MKSRLLRLNGFAETLIDQIEKRKIWFLAGFSIIYLAVTCFLASYKLMWNDELYTFYISRLSDMSEVWSALSTGAEQTPPFFYAITRTSMALFGANELSMRLPEVIGFLVMSVCLFHFVYKRASALYGFVAMLFPLVTGAFFYAYDARPYALVMGFSSLALVCWQSAAEKLDRKILLAGLGLSLAAAVSCHYYAVFVFIPLAIGEAVRSISLRRLDLPVWLTFGLGATPLIGFLPLINRAMSYSSTFWSKPQWMAIPLFYFLLLSPIVLPLLPILVLSAFYPETDIAHRQSQKLLSAPPIHEILAALGFMAIPAIAVTLCMLITGAFTDRYAMPAVIGISIIVAFAAQRLLHNRVLIAVTLVFILCGSFLTLALWHYNKLAEDRSAHTQTEDFLRSKGPNTLPIVVSDPHTFMVLAHYGSRDIAGRVIYLADSDASLRYLGHNSVEKGMLDLIRPWFRLRVENYKPFINTEERFLVYGGVSNFLNWLLSDLDRTGMNIEFLGRNKDATLLLVSPKIKVDTPAPLSSREAQIR